MNKYEYTFKDKTSIRVEDNTINMDSVLALKQSIVLLLGLSTATGLTSYFLGDTFAYGVTSGFLMAVIILLGYYWLDILGNPEQAGWFK